MRKIFLEHLPMWDKGSNKGKIKWKDCIGCSLNFIYDEINGTLQILDYSENQTIKVKYNNDIKKIKTHDLHRCRLGKLVKKTCDNYKFNIGEIIGNLKILECKREKRSSTQSKKGYIYECLICGNQDLIHENELNRNRGCNVCSSKKVVIGINDLYTSNPEIKILLKDKNKGYSLTKGSGKKEIFKCPDCGHEKLKTVRDVVNYGYSCPRCSDGLSYPEKIMLNILDQLNINFECQKTFKWSENRRYDFYIPSLNMIIETHGRQHYEDSFNSVKEEQINDEIKERLAKDNEIKHYIIIDCRVSDVHFIKENILNSKLNLLFDISKIDWKQCHEFACNSLIKTASDLWNKGIKSSITIAKMLKLARTTINRYLKQGAELGWSDYDPKRAQRENAQKRSETNKKQIIQLSTENKLIKEWDSIKSASEFLMVNTSSISNVLRKYRKTAYGFKWMYKEDYDQYIKQAN